MDESRNPSDLSPDQLAAHEFLAELRTRITTQPLPYQYGVEARALESLWEVFGQARKAIEENPGCMQFAKDAANMLNVHLRPVTAKWHRAYSEGRLNSRDGADEFRIDLQDVRISCVNLPAICTKWPIASPQQTRLLRGRCRTETWTVAFPRFLSESPRDR
jgi:hypothetical protein